jgi:hypothetical protein
MEGNCKGLYKIHKHIYSEGNFKETPVLACCITFALLTSITQ